MAEMLCCFSCASMKSLRIGAAVFMPASTLSGSRSCRLNHWNEFGYPAGTMSQANGASGEMNKVFFRLFAQCGAREIKSCPFDPRPCSRITSRCGRLPSEENLWWLSIVPLLMDSLLSHLSPATLYRNAPRSCKWFSLTLWVVV